MDIERSTPSLSHTSVKEFATSRPRVLGWLRSAAILDGDWGTSVAYVMGIGFALAGYSSFYHLVFMMALTTMVAVNYITICRLYPNGGGVYSSVYHRSQLLAVVGALLLAADYVVTMSLSVLDACHYLGLEHPAFWAIVIIAGIGTINWYGPKHSGGLALAISLFTLLTLAVIIFCSAPTALTRATIVPPQGGFFYNWGIFVGVVLSLSGIEAISNMTGLMQDPARDSRRAILSVLAKVIIANLFLALAMHAIQGLVPGDHLEDMLRFLGEHYVGVWFGWFVAFSLGILLISAGNTALNDLISIQFLMAVDKELPSSLRKLNRHGVPIFPLVITTLAPITVLLAIHDVESLAHLYAIGLVGAMIINLGSTATDKTVSMKPYIKILMLVSALVLVAIETSIAIKKHEATIFALTILVLGLAARQLAKRKQPASLVTEEVHEAAAPTRKRRRTAMPSKRYLLAMKELDEHLLKFAVEEAKQRNALLFVLRVQEISVGLLPARMTMSVNGAEERIEEICIAAGIDFQLITIPSYDIGYTIVEQAATFGVDRVILGTTKRSMLDYVLRGSVMRSLGELLPEDVQLVIFGG
ncbi:MAG TPA: universal stress protein [Bacteroidota bacterium]|nr:universal stress protein [Bacteroidota bacterium]